MLKVVQLKPGSSNFLRMGWETEPRRECEWTEEKS